MTTPQTEQNPLKADYPPHSSDIFNAVFGAFPLPSREVAELADSFARIARDDFKASSILFRSGCYADSVYLLQQSVEKASKAFGLVNGIVKPTSQELVGEVGHQSALSLLIHLDELSNRLARAYTSVITNGLASVVGPGILQNQLKKIDKSLQGHPINLPTDESIKKDIVELRNLRPEEMWRATLRLDRSVRPVDTALRMLEAPVVINRSSEVGLKAVAAVLGRAKGAELSKLPFFLGLGRASPKAYPLSLLTMWHERETRYPPINKTDYWDQSSYTLKEPLVKALPMLFEHTAILTKGVGEVSQAALSLGKD